MSDLGPGTAEEVGFDPARIRLIEEKAAEWIAVGRMPCLSLLVARHGKVVLQQTWGKQTAAADSPDLTAEHVFNLASFQKPMVATVAMILVDEGILSLNRPVREYIPEIVQEGTDAILVHHLLTHTSGYMDVDVFPEVMQAREAGVPDPEVDESVQSPIMERLLQKIYQVSPRKRPGERNIYSSVNPTILAEIIRRLESKRLAAVAEERLFQPVGMTSTWLRLPRDKDHLVVTGNVPELPWLGADQLDSSRNETGSGGGYSNATDIARLIQMFLNGGYIDDKRILSGAAVHEMTRNQIPGIPVTNFDYIKIPEASWGLGWMVQGSYRWKYDHGALQPAGETFYHQGMGTTGAWGDRRHGIVGVYQSITGVVSRESMDMDWEFPTFQNMVTAAVIDS